MSDFDRAFAIVIGLEGDYSDDPRDPGGETKFGITKRNYPDLDIARLSVDQAKAIYRQKYWDADRCDSFTWPINCLLFEAGVNVGAGTGAKLLQQSLGVNDDGIVGPATIRAAASANQVELVARLQAKLGVRYAQLPGAHDFLEGWLYREFLAEEKALAGAGV